VSIAKQYLQFPWRLFFIYTKLGCFAISVANLILTFIKHKDMQFQFCLFFYFMFTISNSVLHAQFEIKGIVQDMVSDSPIEFATIALQNKSIGVYSDSNGVFTISNFEYSKNDSLIISFIGYKTEKISIFDVQKDSTIILLRPLVFELNEVIVEAKKIGKLKNKKLGIGKKRTNDSFSSRVNTTYEFAVLIPNSNKLRGFFRSIDIYITQFDHNEDPFRLNLYSVDTICNCPGESLLRSSQYVQKAQKGWNSISVEDQFIEIPSVGFFISYERLSRDSNPELNAQHHSIGWIKNANSKINRIFIKTGDDIWSLNNKFSRKNNVPLVRTHVEIFN